MATVLVTGVDGFTGRYLAPVLRAAGHAVHGLVQRMPADTVDGVVAMHVADLTSVPEITDAVRKAAPERVIHLAGISFVASDAELMYRVNLLGTRNLLEALIALPSAPEAVVLASSANVYGNTASGRLEEGMPPAPANDYAVSKLAMEHVARLYTGRLPIIICRPFNYTGVGQSEAFLLPKIVAHVRRGATQIELGNLDVARDFSDVREVATIYARLLDTPAALGATLNICSGRAFTLGEVLKLIEEISGKPLEVRVNADFVRPNEVRVLLGDRTRLDAILAGPSTKIPLRDTLRWMIEH